MNASAAWAEAKSAVAATERVAAAPPEVPVAESAGAEGHLAVELAAWAVEG